MSDDERLAELLVRWKDEYQQGHDLSPAELCRDIPHLIERAAREIAQCIHQWSTDAGQAPGPTPVPAPPGASPPTLAAAFAGLRYEPLRHHASGGLGDVFVARDQELGREIALKRIQPRFADEPDSRARFEREAEITGRLEHPGVVPLYGRGCDADGRPYYAMRFIRGRSLRSAIVEFYKPENAKKDPGGRAVAFRGLLQSFTAACNTVAYAHSRGVIHRDLKPDNIMLGPYGETLVVDWGLAKYVGRDEPTREPAEESVRPTALPDGRGTETGAVVGTAAFMSAEQALGRKDVGPASDVFSLGATLFQLLTGRPPYQGTMALVDAAAGKHASPRQVRRDVPRALEAVCLKAMAFQPEGRYATARDLAREVDRWLADEPPSAYREPWRVRAWRWVKRHRTPVAATTAALLVGVLLVGGGLWWKLDQDARATAAATRQAQQRDQEVRSGLAEAGLLRDQGRFGEARTVLKQVEARLSDGGPAELVNRVAHAEKDLKMADDLEEAPLLAAQDFEDALVVQRYRELFQVYGIDMEVLNSTEAAARIQASEIHEQLIVALDFWASELPTADGERGRLVDTAHRADGDDRRKEFRQAWSQADRETLERQLDGWDISALPPTTTVAIARRLFRLGSASRCEQVLRTVQQVHPNDFWSNHDLYQVLDETPARREEALGFLRAAVAVKPDSPGAHNNLGVLLNREGKHEEAEKEFRRAIQIKEDYYRALFNLGIVLDGEDQREDAEKEFRRAIQIKDDYPRGHLGLGNLLVEEGRREEAEKEYRRAIQLKEDLPGAHVGLGILLFREGKRQEAEKECRRALQLKEDYLKEGGPGPHVILGELLAEDGQREEAEKEYRRAIQIKEDYPDAHNGLGSLLDDEGKREEAEKEYRRALQLKGDYPEAHLNLGNVLQKQGKWDEAEKEYRRALQLKEDYPLAHHNLAFLLARQGRLEEAEKEYRRALQVQDDYPKAHVSLGVLLVEERKWGEAEKEFRRAIQIKPDEAKAHVSLGELLAKQGRLDEAEKELRRALQLKEDDPGAHDSLGNVMTLEGRWPEAEKEYRRAIQLKEDQPGTHYNLGRVLFMEGKQEEAEKEYRRAIQIKDDIPNGHYNLGLVLQRQGKFGEAIPYFQTAMALLPAGDSLRDAMQMQISVCQRLQELDRKLPAVLRGEVQADAPERVEFADLCRRYKARYATAARLYKEAFTQQPALADDLKGGARCSAARAAALAGAGKAEDASNQDEKERTRLRHDALDWLRADLTAWDKRRHDDPKAGPEIQQTLQHWKNDADLAGVRDADALAKLPESEREAWRKLWTDVDALSAKMDPAKKP